MKKSEVPAWTIFWLLILAAVIGITDRRKPQVTVQIYQVVDTLYEPSPVTLEGFNLDCRWIKETPE